MINEINIKIQQLNNEYSELKVEREKIKKRLFIIDKTLEDIRKSVAQYYENIINKFIIDNNIHIIIPRNLPEKKIIDSNNLLIINSQYPGYSFRTKNGFLLSDYYDYNFTNGLEYVVKMLQEEMLKKTGVFIFPDNDIIMQNIQ